MSGMGHNSKTSFAQGQLKSLVDRIERLEEEKKTISGDIKEIYAEAKATGFDTKILRKIVAIRKQDAAKREEEQAMLDLYMEALGMLRDTPLGQAAVEREFKVTPELRKAVAAFGTPTPLTEEEKEKGVTAAFIDKTGHRVSISVPGGE